MALLLQIDQLVLCDHYYLDGADECYYFLEFIAGGGYKASETNSLISNFKKEMNRRGRSDWGYKAQAIDTITSLLINSLPGFLDNDKTSIVPIPPSKHKGNPDYDDRLMQVLLKYQEKFPQADVREILTIKEDTTAVHTSSQKRDIAKLEANLNIDVFSCKNLRDHIVLFDDVITTGAHFKACAHAIQKIVPEKKIMGVFVARRSISASAAYEFKDIEI